MLVMEQPRCWGGNNGKTRVASDLPDQWEAVNELKKFLKKHRITPVGAAFTGDWVTIGPSDVARVSGHVRLISDLGMDILLGRKRGHAKQELPERPCA